MLRPRPLLAALLLTAACAPPAPGDAPPTSAPATTSPALPDEPAEAAPQATTEALDAGPTDVGPTDAGPTDAGPTDAGPTDAGAALAPALLHDEPPWPAAGTRPRLILTWVAYPRRPQDRAPDMRNVELVARIGDVARRIPLGDVRGGLFPPQHVCAKSARERGLVAEVSFQEGGWSGFEVHRAPADTLTITATYHVCGMCTDDAGQTVGCPEPPPPVVAVLHVPADARIEERLVRVEGPGQEERYECPDG